MKHTYLLLIILVLFGSCENELEVIPPSSLTFAGFWDSEDGANAAHIGLYGAFRSKTSTYWGLGELRSDIWGGRTYATPSSIDFIESNISSTIVPYKNWAGLYSVIHKLNDFIHNVPNVSFSDETNKAHMMGEAYGMRAYIYFVLLKTWGDVPISIEPQLNINPANTSRARSSKIEVMAQIKSDIKSSLESFGSDGSFWNNSKIYWSKAATLTLKGEVFIWSGKILGGGNPDYTEAKKALEAVAGLDVKLENSYAGLWDLNNENNDEFIFTMSYEVDEATNFYSAFTGRTREIKLTFDSNGNSMESFIANSSNVYGPSERILLATDDELDLRRDATFIRLYEDDNGGSGYFNYNGDKYVASILNKFLGSVADGSRISDSDVPLYRYADVILLLAEAKNNLGEDPSVEINQIRSRAYGDNYVEATHAYVNGSQLENTNAILNERLKEFIGEGKRWYDLRRAGDEFVYQNVQYVTAETSYLLELPITIDMMGRNPLLLQTTGYED